MLNSQKRKLISDTIDSFVNLLLTTCFHHYFKDGD